jgi:hypothetical protein
LVSAVMQWKISYSPPCPKGSCLKNHSLSPSLP